MGEAILAVLLPPARTPGGAAPARPGAGGQGFAAMVDGSAAEPESDARLAEEAGTEVAGGAERATGRVADLPSEPPAQVMPPRLAAEPPVLEDAAPIPASEASIAPLPMTPLEASTAPSPGEGSGEGPGVPPEAPRPGRSGAEPALWPHRVAPPGLLRATEVQARPEGPPPSAAAIRPEAPPVLGAWPAAEAPAAATEAAAAGAPSAPSGLTAPGAHPAMPAGVLPPAPTSASRGPEDVAARRAGVSAIPAPPARPEPQGPTAAPRPDATRGPNLAEVAPASANPMAGGATFAAGPAAPPGAPVPQAAAAAAPPPAGPTLLQVGPTPRSSSSRGAPGVAPAAVTRRPALGDRAEAAGASAPPFRPVRPALAESDPGARPWTPEGPAEPVRLTAEGPGSVATPAPRAETPEGATARRIAEGVAQTVAQSPSLRATGAAEMTLAPEELGTLHLRVEGDGAGLRLVIEALRPETADLLRRHAEVLRQELRQEGLGALSVSIGGGEAKGERGAAWPPPARETAPETPFATPAFAATPASSRPRGSAGGVDLRL